MFANRGRGECKEDERHAERSQCGRGKKPPSHPAVIFAKFGAGGGEEIKREGGRKKEDGTLEGEMGGKGVGEPAIRKVQTWVDLSLSLIGLELSSDFPN